MAEDKRKNEGKDTRDLKIQRELHEKELQAQKEKYEKELAAVGEEAIKVFLAAFQQVDCQSILCPQIEGSLPIQEVLALSGTYPNPYFGKETPMIHSICMMQDVSDSLS